MDKTIDSETSCSVLKMDIAVMAENKMQTWSESWWQDYLGVIYCFDDSLLLIFFDGIAKRAIFDRKKVGWNLTIKRLNDDTISGLASPWWRDC